MKLDVPRAETAQEILDRRTVLGQPGNLADVEIESATLAMALLAPLAIHLNEHEYHLSIILVTEALLGKAQTADLLRIAASANLSDLMGIIVAIHGKAS